MNISHFNVNDCRIGLLQPLAYAGINYSSPSLATALGNMLPAYTYLIAIILK